MPPDLRHLGPAASLHVGVAANDLAGIFQWDAKSYWHHARCLGGARGEDADDLACMVKYWTAAVTLTRRDDVHLEIVSERLKGMKARIGPHELGLSGIQSGNDPLSKSGFRH